MSNDAPPPPALTPLTRDCVDSLRVAHMLTGDPDVVALCDAWLANDSQRKNTTQPTPLTTEQLAEIRERAERFRKALRRSQTDADVDALLSHIAALEQQLAQREQHRSADARDAARFGKALRCIRDRERYDEDGIWHPLTTMRDMIELAEAALQGGGGGE